LLGRADNNVYASPSPGHVEALDPHTGVARWTTSLNGKRPLVGVTAGSGVVAVSDSSQVTVLDASDGYQRWIAQAKPSSGALPAAIGTRDIYLVQGDTDCTQGS